MYFNAKSVGAYFQRNNTSRDSLAARQGCRRGGAGQRYTGVLAGSSPTHRSRLPGSKCRQTGWGHRARKLLLGSAGHGHGHRPRMALLLYTAAPRRAQLAQLYSQDAYLIYYCTRLQGPRAPGLQNPSASPKKNTPPPNGISPLPDTLISSYYPPEFLKSAISISPQSISQSHNDG